MQTEDEPCFQLASDLVDGREASSLSKGPVPVSSFLVPDQVRQLASSFRTCEESMDAIFSGDVSKLPSFVGGCVDYLSVGLPPPSDQREYVIALAQRAGTLVQTAFLKASQHDEAHKRIGTAEAETTREARSDSSSWKEWWQTRVLAGALLGTEWRCVGGVLLSDKIGMSPVLLLVAVTARMDGMEAALFQAFLVCALWVTHRTSWPTTSREKTGPKAD